MRLTRQLQLWSGPRGAMWSGQLQCIAIQEEEGRGAHALLRHSSAAPYCKCRNTGYQAGLCTALAPAAATTASQLQSPRRSRLLTTLGFCLQVRQQVCGCVDRHACISGAYSWLDMHRPAACWRHLCSMEETHQKVVEQKDAGCKAQGGRD